MCVYVCVPTHTYTQSVLFIWGFLFPFYQRALSFIVSCPFGSFWSTEGLGNMSDGQGRMNFGVVNIHSARVHWPLLPSLTLLTHHPLEQDKKKKQQKKTMSVSFASSDNRPFFFKTHLVAFCLSGILIQIQFSFSFEKKNKNEKRKLIHELDEILIGLAYRGQRTQSSLLDQNPVLGSKANSRAVTHFLYSLFFFFFYVSERKTFFSPFKIVTVPFFLYRLPFIDWQQYVTKNIN